MAPTGTCFEERLQDGFYGDVISQLQGMGTAFLGAADFGRDFFSEPEHNNGTRFVNAQRKVFHAIIFGEVVPAADGTHLSAKGSHYTGTYENVSSGYYRITFCSRHPRQPNYINDSTRVKDILVLGPPTLAPPELLGTYNDQIGTLNEVRQGDIEKEKSAPIVSCYSGTATPTNATLLPSYIKSRNGYAQARKVVPRISLR